MEALLTDIIAGLPNLAFAALFLVWVTRTLDRVLDVLLTLLSALVDAQIVSAQAATDETQELEPPPLRRN